MITITLMVSPADTGPERSHRSHYCQTFANLVSSTLAWGYPVYIPAYAPYMGFYPYMPMYYPVTPGCMALGVGAAGNCCQGTCGGAVAAGGCGSGGSGACAGGESPFVDLSINTEQTLITLLTGAAGGCGGGGAGGFGGGGGGCAGGGGEFLDPLVCFQAYIDYSLSRRRRLRRRRWWRLARYYGEGDQVDTQTINEHHARFT